MKSSILTKNLSAVDVAERSYDVGVWFCGYEERSPWLVGSRYRPKADIWFQVQVEEDRGEHCAIANLQRSDDSLLGGTVAKRNWDGHWRQVWRRTIAEQWARVRRPIRLVLDISSMPRAVYAPLLVEASGESRGSIAELTLAYVPGEYRGSFAGHQQLDGLRTIAGLEGRSSYQRDPAFVMGLGYDGTLADAVIDLFQIDHFSCCYADPGISATAADECRNANQLLLERCELVETATVGELSSWLGAFERLTSWYSCTQDVLLLPLGPKPQVVAAILFAIENPRVGFRCLRTSTTRAIDVGVSADARPLWMNVEWIVDPIQMLDD